MLCSLIHSGDKNAWLWPLWRHYYTKFWDHRQVPTVFLSEEKDLGWDKVENIKTGTCDWSTGLINALDKVDYEYVIYQHEDFFLVAEPSFKIINNIVDIMKDKDLQLVKCCGKQAGTPGSTKHMTRTRIFVHDRYLQVYPNHLDYLTSHQISIWNKEFLKSTLLAGESPWEHEIEGTKRLRKRNIEIHAWCSDFDDPVCDPIPYDEVITKGQERRPELIKEAQDYVNNH